MRSQQMPASTPMHVLDELITQALTKTGSEPQCAIVYFELRPLHPGYFRHRLIELLLTRLQALLRPGDQLIQLDSHCAALFLHQISGVNHALLAAHRAQQLLTDVAANEQKIYPQIGIALAPEHGKDSENLLDAAKIAAHQFAQEHIGVYDPERDWLGQQIARLETPLRTALQQNEFQLAFQPQINLITQQTSGLEVLLRWHHSELGAISPYQIISVSEYLGILDQLTQWIIQSSLRSFAQLRQGGYSGSLSINLAPSNLRDPYLADFIANALAVWGVPANKIIFEITESAVIEEFASALKQLQQIKAMGCQLALDDFGTGYSSLAYLKRLPIDELKIDRSFVMNLATDEQDRAIVHSVIELAHRLSLTVTAEGVETDVENTILQQLGCNTIQGFYFSKPLGLDEALAYIKQRVSP